MPLSAAARDLWAKSDPDGGLGHPVIAHLLDVAACAATILEREPTTTLDHYAADLGLAPDQARAWVCALVGLHDLGKASPAFQQKWELGRQRVWDAGLDWPLGAPPIAPPRDVPHNVISRVTLPALLIGSGWTPIMAHRAADAVGAHHGYRASREERKRAEGKNEQGRGAWADARTELYAAVLAVLEVPTEVPTSFLGAAFERIAGLTSFADWIGSSLPRATLVDSLSGYYAQALERARHALDTISWTPRVPLLNADAIPTLTETFAYLGTAKEPFAARALQLALEKLLDTACGPALYLIEAPMGEGKTEAALYAHLRLQVTNGHRGLYVALPTQATGNAMFSRVARFLVERAGACGTTTPPLDLQLLHGAATLNRAFQALIVRTNLSDAPEEGADSPDLPREGVRASEWFTRRKRALLSEYGVGTVDQALLAILGTKHQFVRLWGLANRVVILDEVHAYDTYTGTLIETLVRWLHALGSSVILMSATLPTAKRRALLAAYGAQEDTVRPYPRITRVVAGQTESATFQSRPGTTLTLRHAPTDPDALATLLRDLARDGGCVACIVNTVSRAQAIYTALCEMLLDDVSLLFHARYPADERLERENGVLAAFGVDGQARPRRAILIATQVVEQSLDLDFDVLVTDLAPIDLVLQRADRLHRHTRPKGVRHGHTTPTLYITGLDTPAPDLGPSVHIYAEYVLLRSWLVLHERATIAVPGEIESLVNAVYDDAQPAGLTLELSTRLTRTRALLDNREGASGSAAHYAAFGDPDDTGWLDTPSEERLDDNTTDLQPADDMLDEQAMPTTRQGLPSVTVIPVYEQGGQYSLGPTGEGPVRFTGALTPDEALEYYRRAVRLSHPKIVRGSAQYLKTLAVNPTGWAKDPLLSRCTPLILRSDRATVGGQVVRLDKALGVVYE